ncbi:MAG: Rieske 2Fe-2S domain-containing protein [Methanobacteriota archaeon]|nr:MAG: Rieske 2Fe-2S domain-containing protein [Euryarchaeota archaeon]
MGFRGAMALQKAIKAADLPPGKMTMAKLGTQEVMIGNVGGRFYAIDEICTHEGGPLHEGTLEGTTVTCPWHEGQYSIETGEANPETDWVRDTKSFPTQVRDGWVWVDV